MGHQTEAACLLESGALYARRVLLCPASGDPIFVGFKAAAFSLYFGDAPIYHFDLEGRWQRAFVDGTHYLKGLDTTVQAIDRIREGENLVLRRRTLGFAEASDLDGRVRSAALGVLEALGSGWLERVEPPSRARPLPSDELRAVPGAGRALGHGGLVRASREIRRDLRSAPAVAPRLPERGGAPGDPGARGGDHLRPVGGGRAFRARGLGI